MTVAADINAPWSSLKIKSTFLSFLPENITQVQARLSFDALSQKFYQEWQNETKNALGVADISPLRGGPALITILEEIKSLVDEWIEFDVSDNNTVIQCAVRINPTVYSFL